MSSNCWNYLQLTAVGQLNICSCNFFLFPINMCVSRTLHILSGVCSSTLFWSLFDQNQKSLLLLSAHTTFGPKSNSIGLVPIRIDYRRYRSIDRLLQIALQKLNTLIVYLAHFTLTIFLAFSNLKFFVLTCSTNF